MFFCTGPPRTYATTSVTSLAPPLQQERFEDAALAAHPQQRVVARVTSRAVELWAASAAPPPLPGAQSRRLAVVRRSGRAINAALADAASIILSAADDDFADASLETGAQLRRVFALWVSDDRLAVVEKGAQTVEFYAFEGVAELDAAARLDLEPEPSGGGAASGSAVPSATLTGAFVEEFALNQGNTARDVGDTAASLSGVTGGKYLFVGMASGLVCVVDVAPLRDTGSWFGEPVRTKMWKIDVLPHLKAAGKPLTDEPTEPTTDDSPLSCYALACATSDAVAAIATLYLVACFEGGKCFIMLVSPAAKSIDQLLSLVNTERDASAACFGRCTSVALSATGSRLALGWSDGGVSLFRLAMHASPIATPTTATPTTPTTPTTTTRVLTLEPLRELSLVPWGYTTDDVGSVSALAWSLDARAVAVGYELRGFALFSLDGCRLMSSLPQHEQPRPDDSALKEACAHGVLQLLWTCESASLLVSPRGERFERLVSPPTSPRTLGDADDDDDVATAVVTVADVAERVAVTLLKDTDGLCLSLSGAPGRCGAWVRTDNSFTRRARDGGVGPAEASGLIHGGDLLVAINDDEAVARLPFEHVVGALKSLPVNAPVTLHFLRLDWPLLVSLAAQALTSDEFVRAYSLPLGTDDDEELSVREYALRMQLLHGDCDVATRPPLLEFEKRAKFDGWAAMHGVATVVAQHRYIKLLLALFPAWDPLYALEAVTAFGSAVRVEQHRVQAEHRLNARIQRRRPVARRQQSDLCLYEFDFARTVPLSGGRTSRLALLERARVRVVATLSLDDPRALVSCASYSVPPAFDAKCAPLRLVAVSASGQQVAVAGQHGFCVLNLLTGKWRLFGNVNDEQDLRVHALLWLREDALVVACTRVSEAHKLMHLTAYPRNHLDEDSVLARLSYPTTRAASGQDASSSQAVTGDCFYALESSEAERHVFCLSMRELWSVGVDMTGSVKANDLALKLTLRRSVKLPLRVAESRSVQTSALGSGHVLDWTVIPRFLHVPDETLRAEQERKLQQEREREQHETNNSSSGASGWFTGLLSALAGGEVPDQYAPAEVLPRFAFLDANGDVLVWDPETRVVRVLCSNVSTLARLFLTAPAWPTQCRLLYGLYGPNGMQLWLPLLDGVHLTRSNAFERDTRRLETFLACHDPLRAKTYAIEFGDAPATAELYAQVAAEYGVALERFVPGSGSPERRRPAPVGASSSLADVSDIVDDNDSGVGSVVASVDDPSATDRMLRFDADVTVLGVQQAFGLLVGLSQDVYAPSGVGLPCFDVFARVQPFVHTLLCFLVHHEQLAWAAAVVDAVRTGDVALATPTLELFLHAMLEAQFRHECSADAFDAALALLQPPSWRRDSRDSVDDSGVDAYCELVAHVARKSEPSRLPLLFPAAGDPLALLTLCRDRHELHTAANFLLVLEPAATASLAHRTTCAAELVAACVERDEWELGQHVVRVARDWENDSATTNDTPTIDRHLATLVYNDFVRGDYERVVASVAELQAKLPPTRAAESALRNAQEEAVVAQRLRDVFLIGGDGAKPRELRYVIGWLVGWLLLWRSWWVGSTHYGGCGRHYNRILLQAVTEARYESWTRVVKYVMSSNA